MSRPLRAPPGAGNAPSCRANAPPASESFHAFDSRMDITPAGMLVFATRYMERDAIVFWDVPHTGLAGRYQFPSIVCKCSRRPGPDRSVGLLGAQRGGRNRTSTGSISPTSRLERLDRRSLQRHRSVVLARRLAHRLRVRPPVRPDGRDEPVRVRRRVARHPAISLTATGTTRGRAGRRRTPSPLPPRRPAGRTGRSPDGLDRRGERTRMMPGGAYDPVWVESDSSYVLRRLRRPAVRHLRLSSHSRPTVCRRTPYRWPASGGAPEWRWAEVDDARYTARRRGLRTPLFALTSAGAEAAITPGVGAVQGRDRRAVGHAGRPRLPDHRAALPAGREPQGIWCRTSMVP